MTRSQSFSLILTAALVLVSVSGCTKRINASSEAKLYETWTEVMESLPKDKQLEFDSSMSMIWFYSRGNAETNAAINGKTGLEIIAMAKDIEAAQPKLDTSSKDKFNASLKAMRESLSARKQKAFDEWAKTAIPASFNENDPKLAGLNGLPFHKAVEHGQASN